MTVLDRATAPTSRPPRDGSRRDLVAVLGALVLVGLAVGIGFLLIDDGVPVLADTPPLLAQWLPHVGPGTVPAILIAALVVTWGPGLASRLGWRAALAAAWAGSLAWTMALVLVDGFTRGFTTKLTTLTEYLHEIPRITDVPAFLSGFAGRISNQVPNFWTTHVAGHPPLATLQFVWLDRLGLDGGNWASSYVVLVGTSAVVAVAVTLRAVGHEDLARRYLPFGVLFPGAVWVGVSADGLFAAVLAWGVALVALAGSRRTGAATQALALVGGLVLGASLFLNYGFVVAMLIPLAVVVRQRAWRVVPGVVVGAAAVTTAFAVNGFWWLDGYHQIVLRYSQPGEFGGLRPYDYWVWGNLAALAIVIGPATVAGLRRVGASWREPAVRALVILVGAAVLAVAFADLSGLSKAETERIWLPFAVWLLPAVALLPPARVRWWLAGQAAVALIVNHLLLTTW